VSSFQQSVAKHKKSVLLAVCRDSASEGVNLPSACARLVVVTAIPYPSYFSAFICAKRQFDEAIKVSIARPAAAEVPLHCSDNVYTNYRVATKRRHTMTTSLRRHFARFV